jgi:hypothetical protein
MTFRGLLADEDMDTITLHTNDGSVGYRIVKFDVISQSPVDITAESVLQVYKVPQTLASITPDIDFSNQNLLAVGVFTNNATASQNPTTSITIFDREIFNQDIYITHKDKAGSTPCNYYLELESMKLDLNENTVVTLKDIRNTNSQ